ncbi:MAG: glycosyltransferase family 2 protein [bacterium]|nr:glycosyltransferase family 2 protein [bacterium]
MINKLVSVIIVNWNGGEVFEDCLESLAKIDYPNWELVVVDNGSADGLPKSIKRIEIIQNTSNLGFAKANNQGYKKARGKYILLLNNDTKVTPDFLTKLVARAEEDSSIGVVQPKIYLMDKPGYLDNAGSFLTRIGFLKHWGFLEKDGSEFNNEKEIFSAKGACMLIKRKVIEEVGLFDDNFVSYFEESDFCWKVWLAGYRVIFYPKSFIYHKVGYTIRRQNVREINYHYYKNRICSLLKNLSSENLVFVLVPHLVISAAISTLFLLRSQPKNAFMIWKAIWWNITSLGTTLGKRGGVQKMRKITDKEIFRRVSQSIGWKNFFADFRRVEKDLAK